MLAFYSVLGINLFNSEQVRQQLADVFMFSFFSFVSQSLFREPCRYLDCVFVHFVPTIVSVVVMLLVGLLVVYTLSPGVGFELDSEVLTETVREVLAQRR